MNRLKFEHILRMEKVIAQIRVAAVLLTGIVLLYRQPPEITVGLPGAAIWCAALAYAAGVVFAEPYQRVPILGWGIASGLLDWGLISLGIATTGGGHSDLYILYFIPFLSIAMRFSFRDVVLAATGTGVGYIAIVLASSGPSPDLEGAALRVGYLLLVGLGVGVLAREGNRHFRAHVREEAQRLAVQEMTATVSHDLMNPIAAVSGLVEIVLESAAENLSLDQRGLLHRINANTQQMSNLVSNLLDAELIERGQQPFRPGALDLNALVRRIVEAQSHQAEMKQIGLLLDLCPRLHWAFLDARMIERLVANLLSNAVKFCPESGAVRVSTRQQGSRVTIEVWNSGSQLPAALQPVLFEKFARQHDAPGIGLGLYICKSVVDIHRGTIAARNATDGGVAFVAELPIAVVAKASADRQEAKAQVPLSLRLPLPSRAGALSEG